ncbi:MAG: hypothetical protein RMJ28_07980, partial [Nitrososphaerota archaeon]|nr:hypothetical protein [Nitrososphaerota archaeon]
MLTYLLLSILFVRFGDFFKRKLRAKLVLSILFVRFFSGGKDSTVALHPFNPLCEVPIHIHINR